MDAALPVARARSWHVGPWLIAGLVSALTAWLYLWMRWPLVVQAYDSYLAQCTRFAMSPGEGICGASITDVATAQLGWALLSGAAIALPCAVLAAAGRPRTFLSPMGAGLAAVGVAKASAWFTFRGPAQEVFGVQEITLGSIPGGTWWQVHSTLAIVADVALLAVPALAIAAIVRPSRSPHATSVTSGGRLAFATFVVAASVLVVWWAGAQLELTGSGDGAFGAGELAIPLSVMAVFGAMIGTDRRWWPWALVPVAILLSGGPAWFVLGRLGGYTMLTWFSPVPVLAAAGFVASAWPRLARTSPDRVPIDPARSPDLRPTAMLNAAAVGLLAATVLAAANDPFPIQTAAPLPTYLGARDQAEGVRARIDLIEGLAAVDARAADERRLETEVAAAVADGSPLPWSDDIRGDGERQLMLHAFRPNLTRLVARTRSGDAYCVQREGGATTWGAADGDAGGTPTQLRSAVANCGERPWSARALLAVDLGPLCAEADDQSVLICRAVDRLVDRIVAGEAV